MQRSRYPSVFLRVYESDIHGEEAQKKAEEDPGWFMFDCSFAGGVNYITFDGNKISGIDKDGNEVFNNTYRQRKKQKDGVSRLCQFLCLLP